MSISSNPYGTTSIQSPRLEPQAAVDFVPIMRRWELLRLFYNTVLVILVLVMSFAVFPGSAFEVGYWVLVSLGGLLANLCYFLGPAIEAYGTRFGLWRRIFTLLLFVAGLGFTALLAMWSIAAFPGLLN